MRYKICQNITKEIKTIYQGKEMWVQVDPQKLQETGEIRTIGEPVVADASITKCDRNGFEITYLAYLFDVFDQLGGQKVQGVQVHSRA